MRVREQEERAVREREERIAQQFALLRGSSARAAVLRLVRGEEVCANALRELRRVAGARWEPGLEHSAETALPGLRIREFAGVDEVSEKPGGELEDLFERGVPGCVGAVRCARGDDGKLLGKKCEKCSEDLSGLGLNVATRRRRSIFGSAGLLEGSKRCLGEGANLQCGINTVICGKTYIHDAPRGKPHPWRFCPRLQRAG